MKVNPSDIIGTKIGRWLVLSIFEKAGTCRTYTHAVCRCECDKVRNVRVSALTAGKSVSCGCYKAEWAAANITKVNTKHGLCRRGEEVYPEEYCIWSGIKQRCYNPLNNGYVNYGARGITVCDRWLKSFEAFLKDMGPRASKKHSIDRIDNDGNYGPHNCRWVTQKVQLNNTRRNIFIQWNGKRQTMMQWADELGLSWYLIHSRHKRGWSTNDIFTRSKQQGKRYCTK